MSVSTGIKTSKDLLSIGKHFQALYAYCSKSVFMHDNKKTTQSSISLKIIEITQHKRYGEIFTLEIIKNPIEAKNVQKLIKPQLSSEISH